MFLKNSILIVLLFTIPKFSLSQHNSDKKGFADWEKESREDIRLLPRYGYKPKTKQQLDADSTYISEVISLSSFKGMREASDHLVQLGFQYLSKGNVRTAMYRFNQAYLFDSTNTDDYWGYGAVYMFFGETELAENMYKIGLQKDSSNFHIWTDYASVYLERYYNGDAPSLDTSITYLMRSYNIEKNYVSTVYKLSIVFMLKDDCDNAMKFYRETTDLNENVINEEYKKELFNLCKP